MKRLILIVLVFACTFFPTLSHSQAPRHKAVASPAQLMRRDAYVPPPLGQLAESPTPLGKRAPLPHPPTSGKIAAVSPVQLGSASNVYTIIRPSGNQVVTADSLDMVAFIHRNDLNVYGGSSGEIRYDVSINGGTSWNSDIGVLNPQLLQPARYPQIAILNQPGGTNPLNARFVFGGTLLNSSGSGFDGHVVGVTPIVTSGTPTGGTEHYMLQGDESLIVGGMWQSTPSTYWSTDAQSSDGMFPTGDVFVNRGDFNTTTGDVDWQRADTIACPNYTGFNGDVHLIGPNIAFSPDGQTGWVAFLGDLQGGADSAWQPVFSKSSDCGQTWGAPMEVNLGSFAWIKDSLQSLWIDSLGNPASDGRATCAFDFDLTVDANGNPHLVVVICTGIDYQVSSGFAKFLVDVTSINGGATWAVNYISPILCFRTSVFGTAPNTVVMDNFVQVSRDLGGCNIFFSWADSDTSLVGGNGNGIGFGESQNLAPNLRICAQNIPTGQRTYPKLVNDLDLLWDGAILFPTMAPIVRSTSAGWNLPIVTATMSGNDPILAATFHYFGNDAFIPNGGWCTPPSMTLGWPFFGYNAFVAPCSSTPVTTCNSPVHNACVITGTADAVASGVTLGDAYPNPSSGTTRITYTLPATMDARLTLHNALGQQLAVLGTGEQAAGTHQLTLTTSHLAAGIYFLQLNAGEQVLSKRILVSN